MFNVVFYRPFFQKPAKNRAKVLLFRYLCKCICKSFRVHAPYESARTATTLTATIEIGCKDTFQSPRMLRIVRNIMFNV